MHRRPHRTPPHTGLDQLAQLLNGIDASPEQSCQQILDRFGLSDPDSSHADDDIAVLVALTSPSS